MSAQQKPKVILSNYESVYDFYASEPHRNRYSGKRRPVSFALHQALGKLIAPRLSYGENAVGAIAAANEDRTPILVLGNHVSGLDPNTAQAAVGQDPGFHEILRDHRLWTVAKDSLFRVPGGRRYLDSRRLVPAFRPKSYPSGEERRQLIRASGRLGDVLQTLLHDGNSVAMFPEGTLNTEDPLRVQKIGDSAAKLVLDTLDAGIDEISLVTLGIYRGPENHWRHASVHMEYFGLESFPATRRDLRNFMQENMQSAVDGAVENY